ncbi:substrate-binding domain-containing protein [Streptomyces sp. NPDC002550]
MPFVSATNWRGGQTATRHLLELGHRRIAMISGPDHPYCRVRLSGCLPTASDQVVKAQLRHEHGYAAAVELLCRPDRPTAVFTANDMQALGVCKAARARAAHPARSQRRGLRRRPGVVWVDPPLTTVHQPLAEMAVAATELALALGRGEEVPQVGLEIATTLTVRESRPACGGGDQGGGRSVRTPCRSPSSRTSSRGT